MKSDNHAVSAYLNQFTGKTLNRLETLRKVVRQTAPQAVELVSYGMIGYKLNGRPLLYIGGFQKHIGLYATPNTHANFKTALAGYKQGKGSVQFPNDVPLPLALIERMIAYRVSVLNTESGTPGRT